MSEITDEMVDTMLNAFSEAGEFGGAQRPMAWATGCSDSMADDFLRRARLALSAVAPLIAAQEREACAMVAGDGARRFSHLSDKYRALMGVAFAIRGRAESKEG